MKAKGTLEHLKKPRLNLKMLKNFLGGPEGIEVVAFCPLKAVESMKKPELGPGLALVSGYVVLCSAVGPLM